MAQIGTYVEYVYSELQVVEGPSTPGDRLVGQLVAAMRFNMGPRQPSRILFVPIDQAANLAEDLLRVLEEFNAFRKSVEEPPRESDDGGAPSPDAR